MPSLTQTLLKRHSAALANYAKARISDQLDAATSSPQCRLSSARPGSDRGPSSPHADSTATLVENPHEMDQWSGLAMRLAKAPVLVKAMRSAEEQAASFV